MSRLKFSLAIVLLYFGLIVPAALAADPPQIKSVQPKQVAAATDASELRVRITGKKKFIKDSDVLVNGVVLPINKVNFQKGDLLALIPANLVSQPGTVAISVKSKDGT